MTTNICKQCKREFFAARSSIRFCDDICKYQSDLDLDESLSKYWDKVNRRLMEKGLSTIDRDVIELFVFNLYVETASIRKTFAAIPIEYKEAVNIKIVHNIIKHYRFTFENLYSSGALKQSKGNGIMDNIGPMPEPPIIRNV